MKHILITLFLICAAGLAIAQQHCGNCSDPQSGQAEKPFSPEHHRLSAVERINTKLDILDKKYLTQLNKTDQREAASLLAEIREQLRALEPYIVCKDGCETGLMPAPERVYPMSDDSFKALKASIYAAMFDETGLKVVARAADENYFTVSQILDVLRLFSFSDDRVSVLGVMYPRCADPENKFKLMNAFLFDSDKDKAAEILGR